ncbi:MAG: (2Fe-2S)-binding protein [Hyphomicrobiales bacterium]
MLDRPVADALTVSFTLNGETVTEPVGPETRLADLLREKLFLTGTKIGCSIGRCGACSVLVDGVAQNACLLLAWQVDGKTLTTIEGIDRLAVATHVKAGLREESAFQCGYCAPGFVVALVSFLSANPTADDEAVIAALEGNICRCTGYHSIVRGALNAAERVRAAHRESSMSS